MRLGAYVVGGQSIFDLVASGAEEVHVASVQAELQYSLFSISAAIHPRQNGNVKIVLDRIELRQMIIALNVP